MSELETYRTLWEEKNAAKHKALEALGEAKLAEKEGRDASKFWAVLEKQGKTSGVEGKKEQEALDLAIAYCGAHPEVVTDIKATAAQYIAEYTPGPGDEEIGPYDELKACVRLVSLYRSMGLRDKATQVDLYLQATYEPQNVGGTVRARLRFPGTGGAA